MNCSGITAISGFTYRDIQEAAQDSVSHETNPGGAQNRKQIPNMNTNTLLLPRAGHGL